MKPGGDPAAVLAAHGLAPGPEGWDGAALAAAAEARGWAWSAEPIAGARPGQLGWKALVFDPASRGERRGRLPTTRHARGRGSTEAEALAAALAGMLAQGGA